MSRAAKIGLTAALTAAAALLLWGAVATWTAARSLFDTALVRTVDISESADETYTLSLQSVGTPVFFGPASGRLILERDGEEIARYRFIVGDDGAQISTDTWAVTWEESGVQVILSGCEQYDEQIVLQFDGSVASETLTTKFGSVWNP